MKSEREFNCQKIGDSCLLFVFFDRISIEHSRFILSLFRSLKSERDFLDLVPAYCDLAVHFNPQIISSQELTVIVRKHIENLSLELEAKVKLHKFPVIYDGEDLERVAQLTKLHRNEVIARHVAAEYTVAMIGFLPDFPYLIGLDESLHVPRLENPRAKVPAGSVAIGGEQTGIYPCNSPGGWNLIGRMDNEGLKLLEPGDKVKFFEVEHEDQL
ncbi:5-oxoprolinase subunit PxpB [Lentisphaera profundi]|uniref:5-oxoprolinase subunit PxpB n=1 Tax=Lentisphaera profundi TaxID=1658616 RepID=A0ABY7VUK4_9BACT|nr:5-oxoprolinase subunit PxpB [Lentisphaera profundi]WDE97896.1 5-oxoprolinase subunit PxpB [Lentisphaera profundi]